MKHFIFEPPNHLTKITPEESAYYFKNGIKTIRMDNKTVINAMIELARTNEPKNSYML